MRFDVHLHDANAFLLLKLIKKVDQLMATQAELAADLATLATAVGNIGTGITKIGGETAATLAKVDELEAALAAAGGTTPEVDAIVADLKSRVQGLQVQVQSVDDLVLDSPTP